MDYREIIPSQFLAKYVKCFWTLEQKIVPADQRMPEPVMPDGRMEIVFNLSDPFYRYHSDGSIETQPRTIVAGQMREFAVIAPSGAVKLFGIRFQPAGAYPFFRFPLSELTGKIENLETVWGKTVRELEEKIFAAKTPGERIAISETFFTRLLMADRNCNGLVEKASQIIVGSNGLLTIDAVAGMLGVSARKLERNFKPRFGLTPKFFSRIVRFQNLLETLQQDKKEDLPGTALSFGYYDQAHLIHEFKEFSGKSPLAFFESEYQFSRFFINAA